MLPWLTDSVLLRLGTVPDRVIAEELGLSTAYVTTVRLDLGIVAHNLRVERDYPPAPWLTPAIRKRLGAVPDRVIANEVSRHRSSVRQARVRLRRIFGPRPRVVNSYLKFLQRIHAMPWFSAPEPTEPQERRIWKARVALLDAVMYEIPIYQLS